MASEDTAPPCVAILDRHTTWLALVAIHEAVSAGDGLLALRRIEYLGQRLLVDSAIEERAEIVGIYAEHDAVAYEAFN